MFQNILQKCYEFLTKYVVNIVFGAIIAFYLISCGIFIINDSSHLGVILIALILYGLMLFVALYVLRKIPLNDRTAKITIFFGSILVYLIWNLIAKTQPVSDYEVLIKGAEAILDGNFQESTFNPQSYFYFYNYQVGFSLYLAGMMKIIGKSLWGLKIVEMLILSFSNVLVFMIAKKIQANAPHSEQTTSEKNTTKIATLVAVIYGGSLFNIAGAGIINNQHISVLLFLLAFWFYLKDSKKSSKIWCGVFLSISYILRPSSVIFVLALFCLEIIKFLREGGLNWRKTSMGLLMIILPFIALLQTYDTILKVAEFVPNSAVAGNLSYYKFVLGIQNEGITGSHTVDAERSLVYYDLKAFDFNYEEYNAATKDFLITRYRDDTKNVVDFIVKKLLYYSGYPDNQVDFALNGEVRRAVKVMRYGGYAQYLWLLILVVATIVIARRERIDNDVQIFLKVAFIGFFLCHILIEVQTRYRYDQYLLLVLLTIPALTWFTKWLQEKSSSNKFLLRRNKPILDMKAGDKPNPITDRNC